MTINITLPPLSLKFPRDLYRKYYDDLHKRAGVYFFYDREGALLYIGQTKNFYARFGHHFSGRGNSRWFYREINEVHIYYVDDPYAREIYETYAINKFKPAYNMSKVFNKPKTSAELVREDMILQLREERRQLVYENLEMQKYFDDMLAYSIDDVEYDDLQKWGELELNRRRIRKIEKKIGEIKRMNVSQDDLV